MHNFKDWQPIEKYSGPGGYTGSAVKLGAGWETGKLYNKLHGIGKIVVAGECSVS
jgi:hypothetical protein